MNDPKTKTLEQIIKENPGREVSQIDKDTIIVYPD